MGFYQSRPKERTWKREAWRLIAVAVLSGVVGSGVTLAATSMNRTLVSPSNVAMSGTSSTPNTTTNVSSSVNVSVNNAITNVVKKVEPDVVAVVNYTTTSDFFTQQTQTQESDIGSGVYFYKDANYAYIVTNNHVVDGGTKVEVVLQSGKHVQAKIVGTDPYTDLAVLKVPISNFATVEPVQFANSDDIQVGEPAIAIGTPMGLDFADSVTAGIVSGTKRMMPVEEPTSQQTLDYQAVIQTDAAINPGNSGGPLLNISGQLIGINSSKIAAENFEGMGFAIPSNEVLSITSELIQTGHAVHPALGIQGYSLSNFPVGYLPNVSVDYGVYVQAVTSADAKAAGLRQGDVIVALNGKTVQTIADLRTALFQTKPGQTVELTVYRGSDKINLEVKVGTEDVSATDDSSGNDGSFGGNYGFGTSPFSDSNPFGW